MRGMIAIVLLAVACGSAEAGTKPEAATQATVAGCDTLLDAGTTCDPCPGNAGSTQADHLNFGDGYSLPDGGTVLTFRECKCQPPPPGAVCGNDNAGVFHSCPTGIIWRACPPLPTALGYPATTCSGLAAEFAAHCSSYR